MPTLSFDFEPAAFGALRLVLDKFAREIRIAVAVLW
jgi:hypothetical protein